MTDNPAANNVDSYQETVAPLPSKSKLPVVVIGCLLLLLPIVGASGFYLGRQQTTVQEQKILRTLEVEDEVLQEQKQDLDEDALVGKQAEKPNLQKYNSNLGYSLYYPSDQLVACDVSSGSALILWSAPFSCPSGHDILYTVSVTEVDKETFATDADRRPISSKTIQVGGREAREVFYTFTEEDGPLFGLKSSKKVIVPINERYEVVLQLLGESSEDLAAFQTILDSLTFE